MTEAASAPTLEHKRGILIVLVTSRLQKLFIFQLFLLLKVVLSPAVKGPHRVFR